MNLGLFFILRVLKRDSIYTAINVVHLLDDGNSNKIEYVYVEIMDKITKSPQN